MATGSKAKQPEKAEEKSRPAWSKRAWTGSGSVEVAVWPKVLDGDDGERTVYSVVAKRTWKDDEGYQSGNAFRPEDILPLALFLQEAFSFISNEQAKR